MFADEILLDISLPDLPPTVNQLYATVGGRRIKSSEGRTFAALVGLEIHMQQPGFIIPVDRPLEFFLVSYYPNMNRFNKNDSDGRLKAAKDSVFEASFIDGITGKKANDSIVIADHTYKFLSEYPDRYPRGYCHLILARCGYADKIMRKLKVI